MRMEGKKVVLDSLHIPPQCELVRTEGGFKLILRMKERMATAERGHMLLELEKRLRREVDFRIEVFLEPSGDVNKLRQRLRGVKV